MTQEPMITIRQVDGTSFEVKADGEEDCSSLNPVVGKLRRAVAKAMSCHPSEVALFVEGTDQHLETDDPLLRPEPAVIQVVRKPPLSTDEAAALQASMAEKKVAEFEAGLTKEEFEALEQQFGMTFPPELRTFLSVGVPVGKGFPKWRTWTGDNSFIEGVLFDVESNNFWWKGATRSESWGEKPKDMATRLAVAQEKLSALPPLIPVYMHRAMPSSDKPGLPVLSVHQTDVMSYGPDLASYLVREFRIDPIRKSPEDPEYIVVPFWGEFDEVDGSDASSE
eukprot:TRINITY_DN26791_c0_g1_i1.p1 TRINITY_DN26791_c0_g1~~TRINITY_DN26791_c0_g1_i1.p1  ORF type:complete len:280 (-),score=54.08 TRINITY_DN26791_c0_g1_i1:20-859(-)